MIKTITAAFLFLLTSSCGLVPITEEDIRAASDLDLCISYSHSGLWDAGGANETAAADKIRAEILRRDILSVSQIDEKGSKYIFLGMSECHLIVSLGPPERVNSSAGSWGSRKQYVYNRHRNFIYVEKRKVVA